MTTEDATPEAPMDPGDPLDAAALAEDAAAAAAVDDLAAGIAADPAASMAQLDGIDIAVLLDDALAATHEAFAPNWPIQAKARRAVAKCWGRVADRYLPDLTREHGEVAVAVVVTVLVLAPHARRPRYAPAAGDEGGA